MLESHSFINELGISISSWSWRVEVLFTALVSVLQNVLPHGFVCLVIRNGRVSEETSAPVSSLLKYLQDAANSTA